MQTPDQVVQDPLRDSERRLHAVLNNASVSIFVMDDQQKCIYMNSAAEQLTGWTLAEVLTLDKPLHDIIHHTYPDGRPFPLSECAIDRAFPEHNQTKGEEVFVHKDGSFYAVGFTASPIRDEASKTVGTIIEVRDVREEKRAAERQRLLVNELNHRVKNTLATVQAIAWQTLKQTSPDTAQEFFSRLSVLSKAHDILTRTAWRSASLSEIVNAAIRPFGPEYFVQSGPECDLPPKLAVSLSMVLHELATNALKYGSLREAEGQVNISWTATGPVEAVELDLVWRESGGPPVSEPTRTGFGLRLIERQLKLEFGGQTAVRFHPAGLECTIRLRIPPLPAPMVPQPLDYAHG